MSEVFVNRVAESALTTLDLEELGGKFETMVFDLTPFLFMGLILKEKDYREALRVHDWSVYAGKLVTIICSTDAIIPMWANMLAATYLEPVALGVVYGDESTAREKWLLQKVAEMNEEDYQGKRVVVKGCGDVPVGESVYVAVTAKLRPVVKSIMYGEPCSTVPIYKEKKV